MKKMTFKTVLFLSIIGTTIIACSKKSSNSTNNLPQTITIKPTKVKNGYFSINTPAGFSMITNDPTDSLGSSGYIYKLGGVKAGDSIQLNFQYGFDYGGPLGNKIAFYDDTTGLAKAYYNMNATDSISKVDKMLINNNALKGIIVTHFPNKTNLNDLRIDLTAFNTVNTTNHNIYLYANYALNPEKLVTVKDIFKTVKIFP